jgi:hypothetical protein
MPNELMMHKDMMELAVETVKEFRRKNNMEVTVHTPFRRGKRGSYGFFEDTYEFGRKIGAKRIIYHPSINDGLIESENGIPIAMEVLSWLCSPQDVNDYREAHGVHHVAYDPEHVRLGGLPVVSTLKRYSVNVVELHLANTKNGKFHQDIEGGEIPTGDFMEIMEELSHKNPPADNVIEVNEKSWESPINALKNLGTVMKMRDSFF